MALGISPAFWCLIIEEGAVVKCLLHEEQRENGSVVESRQKSLCNSLLCAAVQLRPALQDDNGFIGRPLITSGQDPHYIY